MTETVFCLLALIPMFILQKIILCRFVDFDLGLGLKIRSFAVLQQSWSDPDLAVVQQLEQDHGVFKREMRVSVATLVYGDSIIILMDQRGRK